MSPLTFLKLAMAENGVSKLSATAQRYIQGRAKCRLEKEDGFYVVTRIRGGEQWPFRTVYAACYKMAEIYCTEA